MWWSAGHVIIGKGREKKKEVSRGKEEKRLTGRGDYKGEGGESKRDLGE